MPLASVATARTTSVCAVAAATEITGLLVETVIVAGDLA